VLLYDRQLISMQIYWELRAAQLFTLNGSLQKPRNQWRRLRSFIIVSRGNVVCKCFIEIAARKCWWHLEIMMNNLLSQNHLDRNEKNAGRTWIDRIKFDQRKNDQRKSDQIKVDQINFLSNKKWLKKIWSNKKWSNRIWSNKNDQIKFD
jgi:hypothetical protein